MHEWVLWVERPDTKKVDIYRQSCVSPVTAIALTKAEFMKNNRLAIMEGNIIFLVRRDYEDRLQPTTPGKGWR